MPSNDQANRSMCPVRCSSIVRSGSRPSGSANALRQVRVGQHPPAVVPQADARDRRASRPASSSACRRAGCPARWRDAPASLRHRGHVVPRVRIGGRRGCGIGGRRAGRPWRGRGRGAGMASVPASGRHVAGCGSALAPARAIAPMSCPMPPCPMSAIVSTGRGSSVGHGARRPARAASVPAANPVRSIACAKIVNASWPVGSTITSKVSATAMRNSSTVTGRTGKPSAATTVIFRPGNAHVEVRHRRAVDEPQPHPLARREQPRPVAGRRAAVHQVGVGVAA